MFWIAICPCPSGGKITELRISLFSKKFASSLTGDSCAEYLCSLEIASISCEARERLRVGSLVNFSVGK